MDILQLVCSRRCPLDNAAQYILSGSERVILRRAVYRHQFVLATSPLRITTSNFIFQLNTCVYSHYVTSSRQRGWVCPLQLLLVLASAVILGTESHGIYNHILLSQIRDSPNPEGQVPVFISPRKRVAQLYTPRHWVRFSSPPTSHKGTVEVLERASTRGTHPLLQVACL
jgi:hypothetical protein